jgi:hypothetical protein
VSHTLYDPDQLVELNGGHPPTTMGQFQKLQKKVGEPLAPAVDLPSTLPRWGPSVAALATAVPSLKDLGYADKPSTPYKVISIA